MRKFFVFVLVLICAIFAGFLPGLAWGHFAALRSVATPDDEVKLISNVTQFETDPRFHWRTFTYACNGSEYSYETPAGTMVEKKLLKKVGFFDDFGYTLGWAMFGTSVLASHAPAIATEASAAFGTKRGGLFMAAAVVAFAGFAVTKGYRIGFDQTIDCGRIGRDLTDANQGLWKVVAKEIENEKHLQPVTAPVFAVLGEILVCRQAFSPTTSLFESMLPDVPAPPLTACEDPFGSSFTQELYLVFSYKGAVPEQTRVYARLTSAKGSFATKVYRLQRENGHYGLLVPASVPPGSYNATIFAGDSAAASQTVQIFPPDAFPLWGHGLLKKQSVIR